MLRTFLVAHSRRKEKGRKKKASGKGVCTLDAEKDPAELGRHYVYPGSLFAVGKCFMLKDLITNVILLVMRVRIDVFKFLFICG